MSLEENIQALEKKIEHLETRQAFQEDTVESLNSVIIQYQKDLEKLEVQIIHLSEQMKHNDHTFSEVESEEPPPPHY